jgi:flap endonuclease-1
MGIKNLMKVLNNNTPNAINNINISELKGKRIAIDTSIILYQYITAIKSSGDDLRGPNNISTSHIMGILVKALNYLKMEIIPIFVFDGNPPLLKMKILNDRSNIKKDAISKLIELDIKINYTNANLNTNIDNEDDFNIILDQETLSIYESEKIKLLKKSVSISQNEMIEACEIINLLGIPNIFAPEEADSQCAYLSINNMVDYVASEDMDLLTFGSKIIIRNFMKKNMFKIDLDEILLSGNKTMDEFIDICILLGCDYTETITGIGQKKVWGFISKYGSIEELITLEPKIISNKYKIPDNFRFIESREYFKNPRHIKVEYDDLIIKIPQLNKLKSLLLSKYGFSENTIENLIGFLRNKYNQYDHIDLEKKAKESDDIFDDEPIKKIKEHKKVKKQK